MATQQRIVVPFAGHRIGEGVSANTLERVGTGLVAESEGEDALAGGQTAEFKFRMVTSQSSLEEELKIGVGVDARYGLFSGSARFDFAKSSSVDSKSTYILATCTVKNALRAGENFHPTDAALQLIEAEDKDGFHGAFGTRFVQALRTGGELLVLVRITSSKIEHQSRIAAKLHAAYQGLAASADFKVAFDQAKSDTSSHTEVDITSAQVGGQGLDIQFVGADADKIREQMNVFAQAVHQNPVAYEAELLSYDALALPFPSEDELEDKRAVLEDCLVQKQRYWSILADLRLAQSNTANQLFSALPPQEELISLTARFSSLLNALMEHARKVASGAIEPALFVAQDEPARPVLKRRSSTNFGVWWTRRDDPTLLADERFIVHSIGQEVGHDLSVSILDATPDAMERGSTMIERLDLFDGDLDTIKRLPTILDAPLRKLSFNRNRVESLEGVEQFPGLESIGCHGNRISDLAPVAGLGGLTSLFVIDNEIADLDPIAALGKLEDLHLGGNQISSLEPLRSLERLRNLTLANGEAAQVADGVVVRPFRFLDNPIDDASALNELPLLANVLTKSDELFINVADFDDLAAVASGTARRLGRSNRFDLTPDGGGTALRLILATFLHLPGAGADAVLVSAFAPSLLAVAVTFADPADPTRTMRIGEIKARLDAEPALGFGVALLVGGDRELVFEADAV